MTPDDRFEQILEHLTRDGRVAFTLHDACKAAGISQSFLWKLAREGKLALTPYGLRSKRVLAHDLARLIAFGPQ
jgi:hypothetical protein